MAWDVIIARLLHIGAAATWFGAGLATFFLFVPASRQAGEHGARYWQVLTERRPFIQFFVVAAAVTVLAGAYLYWRLGYLDAGLAARSYQVLLVGVIAGVVAGIVELGWQPSLGIRIGRLRASHGPTGPTPEQTAAEDSLLREFRWADRTSVVLLIIAMSAMATARYW